MGQAKTTLQDVLLFYTDKKTNSPCWNWTGAVSSNGYGHVSVNCITISAHRFMYEQIKGPVPEGYQIDHTCRNRLCINPEHLEAVTAKVNSERRSVLIMECKRGHELGGDNLYITPDGRRQCRTCRRMSAKDYWDRR